MKLRLFHGSLRSALAASGLLDPSPQIQHEPLYQDHIGRFRQELVEHQLGEVELDAGIWNEPQVLASDKYLCQQGLNALIDDAGLPCMLGSGPSQEQNTR